MFLRNIRNLCTSSRAVSVSRACAPPVGLVSTDDYENYLNKQNLHTLTEVKSPASIGSWNRCTTTNCVAFALKHLFPGELKKSPHTWLDFHQFDHFVRQQRMTQVGTQTYAVSDLLRGKVGVRPNDIIVLGSEYIDEPLTVFTPKHAVVVHCVRYRSIDVVGKLGKMPVVSSSLNDIAEMYNSFHCRIYRKK